MDLNHLLKSELIELEQGYKNKEEVLKGIARLAKRSKVLKDVGEEELYKKLKNREKISTTGFGKNIAIPHCPIADISDFVIGAIVVPAGVDFGSVDGQPTKLFIFIILPKNKRNEHIRLLSRFANALKDKNNVKELLSCKDAATFREILLRQTQAGLQKEESEKYNLFNIITQNEEIFEKVLHTFAQVENCTLSIMDSENASVYLYKQPLFSGFYDEEEKQYNQLISAVVNESYANDLIRQLNMILDDFDENQMAFWVQELFYYNGSINL
ncbi:MAG: PTS sugar transporter subunit IIA [Candidatus Marinimicrobia bacterium]|nr:PTS sugar transporter subunit IIA [Candidatus Neomarinimicrobiota bacterium]